MHSVTNEVEYSIECWRLLGELRKKALDIMSVLEARHLRAIVHGSIARGDVTKNSDIDVFLPDLQSSFQVETAMEAAKMQISARTIIQATPNYTAKAYLEHGEKITISFPLIRMRKVEREFYKFGGELQTEDLRQNLRVAGVDKRLMLIEPTEKGHIESSIIGKEEQTSKILGISVETVLNRKSALLKRDAVGRTGVFIKRELAPDETFELALKRLADKNPAVRRKLKNAA